MAYIDKLRNHRKFDLDDIKEFVQEQVKMLNLHQYVNTIEIEKIFFGMAAYSIHDKAIYIGDDFKEQYKGYKKKCFESNLLLMMTCNDNDLYNMYVIKIILHELWHAQQYMQLDVEAGSLYSKLIDASLKLMGMSGSTYNSLHNRYFHESDAIINSALMTIEFMKFFNVQERTLFVFNKSLAKEITSCYMKSDYQTYGEDTDKYDSPISSMNFIIERVIGDKQQVQINGVTYDNASDLKKDFLLILNLYSTEYSSDDDINNLSSSNRISDNTLKILKDIKNGKIKTTNIFETIELKKNDDKHL